MRPPSGRASRRAPLPRRPRILPRPIASVPSSLPLASSSRTHPRARPGSRLEDSMQTPDSVTPAYWDEACKYLGKRDRVMRKLIPQFGEARLESRGDAFTTLARSIVGQQSSVKAAQAVWDRVAQRVGGIPTRIAPRAVLALHEVDLRQAGLSARKVDYLRDLASHFDQGKVHVPQWAQMDDEAIIE